MRFRHWIAAAALALAPDLPTAAADAVAGTQVGAAGIEVRDAWIRWLPVNLPGAGYFTLVNTGAGRRVLTGASSPEFAEVGMHLTSMAAGLQSMSAVSSVVIEPKHEVRFAEGGYHFMMAKPRRPLRPGDRVPVRLQFEGGASLDVVFVVRAASP